MLYQRKSFTLPTTQRYFKSTADYEIATGSRCPQCKLRFKKYTDKGEKFCKCQEKSK